MKRGTGALPAGSRAPARDYLELLRTPARCAARGCAVLLALIVGAACVSATSAAAATCTTNTSAYSQLVSGTAGLGGYWRLGELSGTAACDVTGNATGIYRYGGDYTLGVPGALANDPDTAATFDGVAGYVYVPDAPPLDPTGALTLEAWVSPRSVGVSQTVIRKDGQYLLRLNGRTIDAYFWLAGSSSYVEVKSPSVLTAGVWQHISVTFDGRTVQEYYDGALVKSQGVSGTLATTTNNARLASSTGYDYYVGALDEPAVYGAALTASQVASHYSAGTNGAPTYLTASTTIGRVNLSWGASGASGLQGYNVYRQNSDGSWPSSPLATLGAAALSYTDTSVTNNVTYTYRVTAITSSGAESSPSNPATMMAGSPCGPLTTYSTMVAGTAGLAGYWRLDEQSGTTACDTAGNVNATYRGGYTLRQPGAITGDADTAVGLDGSSGYVVAPDAAVLDPSSAFTLEAWVKPNSVNGYQEFLRKDGQYILRESYQRLDAFIYSASGVRTELMGPADLGAATYQYVALTYDGATLSLYEDGALVASQAVTGALAVTNNPLRLGSANGYDYFGGSLDEAAVYGVALSASQIASHYSAGSPAPTDPVPTPPTDLVRATYSGSVSLRWAASTDNDLVGYRVYRQNSNGSWPSTPLTTLGTGTTAYTDNGVTNGTAYTYRVTAFDLAGQESGASNQVAATPNPPLTSTGGDPALLAAGDIAGCDTSSQGDALTAALLDNQPGVVAPLGDQAYESGSPDEYAYCYDPTWGRFYSRSMPAPGEHDYTAPDASGYYGYFGALAGDPAKGYYSYNLGAWHVIVLNSECAAVGGCGAGSSEEQWLASDLAANPVACTLAYWHDPLFSSDAVHGNDSDMQAFWQDLYSAGADLVLNGSAHDYERFDQQTPAAKPDKAFGIREIVAGTGGRGHYGFRKIAPNSQIRDNTSYGILKVTLHATSYDWQFLPVAGATFTDAGSTPCHAAPPA